MNFLLYCVWRIADFRHKWEFATHTSRASERFPRECSCPAVSRPDLHRFLRHQHKVLRCGVPHPRVGQFSIGDPGSVLHRRQHPQNTTQVGLTEHHYVIAKT